MTRSRGLNSSPPQRNENGLDGEHTCSPDRLFIFETDEISTYRARTAARRDPIALAATFLERVVERDGHVAFMIDPRTGARQATGEMHHGRAAVVIRALEASGRRRAAARARRRLESDIEAGLRGRSVDGWPNDPPMIGGTLALAVHAGVAVDRELESVARRHSFDGAPWYRVQVVAALGERAPRHLYQACVADLAGTPWAPWTAIAAAALGDRAVVRRCARALASSIRARAPHDGGVALGTMPEVALTALTVEALVHADGDAATAAVRRGRAFLLRWQSTQALLRGPVDPEVALGGFPLAPINDALRSDVTGHAVLALLGR